MESFFERMGKFDERMAKFDKRMEMYDRELSDIDKSGCKNTIRLKELKSVKPDIEAIKDENYDLKRAQTLLKNSVSRLQDVAKWKVDFERFEKLKWELENYARNLQHYQTDVQSMKKQKYKVQSKVSQLENTITRQAESMHLDLKNIKKQRKELKEEREELLLIKEVKLKSPPLIIEDFSSDPRVLENCYIHGLTISEVPRPDYIPLKFEALRSIWGTLSHFDYKHCLRVLSNYKFTRLRSQSTIVS